MEASPQVRALAQKLGIPLSDRSVSGNYCWDGKTLGTRYQEWDNSTDQYPWDHPLATPRLLPKLLEIWAEDLCHDMAHFCLAPGWTRDLPEFGLAVPSWEYFNANGGFHLNQDEKMMDGLLPDNEQVFYEERARLLGVYFCFQAQVPTSADFRYWIPSFAPNQEFSHIPFWLEQNLGIPVADLRAAMAWTQAHPRKD